MSVSQLRAYYIPGTALITENTKKGKNWLCPQGYPILMGETTYE